MHFFFYLCLLYNMNNLEIIMHTTKYKQKYSKEKAIIGNCCTRCGAEVVEICVNCDELGVLTQDSYFYHLEQSVELRPYIGVLEQLKLTPLQQQASDFMLNSSEDCLIWAVCGAGKTEITFLSILDTIKKGNLVCFAIPRIDIVYEIKERIELFFPGITITLLTGSEKILNDANIYIMTTNQILKFKNAFSLIIVDEVDAFPFMHNAKFDFGVNRAKTKGAKVIYLTSTPCDKMLAKNLNTFEINRRWHNFLLPVPKFIYLNFSANKLSIVFKTMLKHSKRQNLVFISNIKNLEIFNNVLVKHGFKVNYVHSKRENRNEIINSFKKCEIDILLTTTILERGVTFDDINVFVMDSSNSHYNKAALIQIAGRVNRKIDFQNGKVVFFHTGITNVMQECNKNIKKMNKKK